MAKKNKPRSADVYGTTAETPANNNFYFGKDHYKWMLIGLGLIILGFVLMMGSGANTRPDGTYDSNFWNDGIFSIVRIRIAPLLVIAGFTVQVYSILKRNKKAKNSTTEV